MKLGFSKLQADDYLMVNIIFWYTLLVVSINKMIAGGGKLYDGRGGNELDTTDHQR